MPGSLNIAMQLGERTLRLRDVARLESLAERGKIVLDVQWCSRSKLSAGPAATVGGSSKPSAQWTGRRIEAR